MAINRKIKPKNNDYKVNNNQRRINNPDPNNEKHLEIFYKMMAKYENHKATQNKKIEKPLQQRLIEKRAQPHPNRKIPQSCRPTPPAFTNPWADCFAYKGKL